MEINIKYDENLKNEIRKAVRVILLPIIFFIISIVIMFGIEKPILMVEWNNFHFFTFIIGLICFSLGILLFYIILNNEELEEIKQMLKEVKK